LSFGLLSFDLFVTGGIRPNGKLSTSLMLNNSHKAVCHFDREKYLKISGNPSLNILSHSSVILKVWSM